MARNINHIIHTLVTSLQDLQKEYGLHHRAIDFPVDTVMEDEPAEKPPSATPIADALQMIETFVQSLPQLFAQHALKGKNKYKEPDISYMLPYTFNTINQVEDLLKNVPEQDQEKAQTIMKALITLYAEAIILYAEDLQAQLIASELPSSAAPNQARVDHWESRHDQLLAYEGYLPVIKEGRLHAWQPKGYQIKRQKLQEFQENIAKAWHAYSTFQPSTSASATLLAYEKALSAAEALHIELIEAEIEAVQAHSQVNLEEKLRKYRNLMLIAGRLRAQLETPEPPTPPHVVTEDEWQARQVKLLEYQKNLAVIAHHHAANEEQRIDREILITKLQIRIATAQKNTDELIRLLKKRKLQLKYQDKGRIFAVLYGMGQGGYCAGFMMALIGLPYFLHHALLAFGWPSLLIIIALTPLLLSAMSNYWVMRKDLGVMSMKFYEKWNPESGKNPKSEKQGLKKYDNYVLAIVSAFLGGILISTLTAFGVYQFFPHAATIALAAVFFTITAVPEVTLNVNHNVTFWKSPLQRFKNAHKEFTSKKGNHYFARLMGWFAASLVGMAFTALALTSLANIVGIPFYVSFPMLSVITFLNISFYFNRAYDHVSRQHNIEEGLVKPNAYSDRLTPRFSLIRYINAFSNGVVALIGFLVTAYSAGWITIHGVGDLALSNMGTLLNFASPAVICCLLAACAVGYLAAASSYTANAGGEQKGYEEPILEDISYIQSALVESYSPKDKIVTDVAPTLPVTYWYRYQKDGQEVKRFEEETYDLLKGVVARPTAV